MKSKIIWALLLSLQASLCAAQDKPNPIDQWLAQAIQKDSSTAGVRDATNVARQKWDAQLNKSYQHLLNRLPADKRELLRTSQRNWIRFRDSEGAVISDVIGAQQGTLFQVVATDSWMQVTRTRALQIEAYDLAYEGE